VAVRAQYAPTYSEFDANPGDRNEGLLLRGRHEIAEFTRARRKPVETEEIRSTRAIIHKKIRPATDFDFIEAPPSAGLVHAYLIDADEDRRTMVHKLLSGRSNMVVRTYRNRAAFLAEAELLDEGCIILSDHVEGEDTALLDFIRQSRANGRFACILLTCEGRMRLAIDAMKAGAVDCLLTPCAPDAILDTLEDALIVVQTARTLNDASSEAREQIDRLTARERDVLHGLLHGQSNKMIAIHLGISPRTVEIYRAHLMEKLGTHSLSETLRIAFTAGMA
jgi:two-component system response regulator FixJ